MINNDERKYLGDMWTTPEEMFELIEHRQKLFIIAGVGAGKSHFAMEDLQLFADTKVLFITSRRTKKDADLNKKINFTDNLGYPAGQSCLVTYAGLYQFLRNHWKIQDQEENGWSIDKWLMNFHIVVIDEVHAIMSDSAFADGAFMLQKFMEYAAARMTVIAMTGTPQMIEEYFQENNWDIRNYMDDCKIVLPEEYKTIRKDEVLKTIQKAKKENRQVVYFVNKKDTITKCVRKLLANEIFTPSQISVIVSGGEKSDLESALRDMNGLTSEIVASSLDTYNGIVDAGRNHEIPQECRILFSTSKMKEGIDINNIDICPIIESRVLPDIIQYTGRFRNGVQTAYIVENAEKLPILGDDYDDTEVETEYAEECLLIDGLQKNIDNLRSGENASYPYRNQDLLRVIERDEKRHPFLRYNFLTDKWELFDLKKAAAEQNITFWEDWEMQLSCYCDNYGIRFYEPSLRRQEEHKEYRKHIDDLFTSEAMLKKRIYMNQKKSIIDMIRKAYGDGAPARNIHELNNFLKENHAPFRFVADKDQDRKIYWQIVKVGTRKKRKI